MFDSTFKIFKDPSAPASILLAIVFDEYSFECFDWDPHVLRMEIFGDFGIKLTDQQSDKLQAAITIMSTDHFENDWHSFNSCIHALNGESFEHDVLYPIEAEQIAAAMPEIETIRTKFMEDRVVFSDEVNVYAGFIFSEYGLFFAPNEFPTAIMPALPGEHTSDSQDEKKAALAEIYNKKKEKIEEWLATLRHP
jgi:hypothetical protein